MSIRNYLTPFDDNLEGLIHDDVQTYIFDYKKMNIYNKKIPIPAQKVWVETPKLKMIGKLLLPNKQAGIISLLLYDQDPEIEKFRLFIEKIEDKIFDIVEGISENEMTFRSSIKYSENYYPTFSIQLPYNKKDNNLEFLFNIYDANNRKISYEKIISGSYIKTFIELSDVWMNATEFGINWKVLQMKIYPEFNFHSCLFEDGVPDHGKTNIPLAPLPPFPPSPPSSPPQPKVKNNIKFVPTIGELLNIRNNLKKIKNECDEM
jgi:hypothetical protein